MMTKEPVPATWFQLSAAPGSAAWPRSQRRRPQGAVVASGGVHNPFSGFHGPPRPEFPESRHNCRMPLRDARVTGPTATEVAFDMRAGVDAARVEVIPVVLPLLHGYQTVRLAF